MAVANGTTTPHACKDAEVTEQTYYGWRKEYGGLMLWREIPEHIRSDNGPEFIAQEQPTWLATLGAQMLNITLGSPWENGYCENFNGTLRDECLNGEIFYSLKEAQIVIQQWRVQYTLPAAGAGSLSPRHLYQRIPLPWL